MHRRKALCLCLIFGLLSIGCPKGKLEYDQGKKAESLQDLDAALTYYQKAVKADPANANFRIKLDQVRFEASQSHVKQGLELRKKGDLSAAVAEFQRAQVIDPSSPIAEQELRQTLQVIADKNRAADAAAEPPPDPNQSSLASMPPEIKPLSRAAINLKLSNDAKVVFDAIGKLAGLTVVYDPDYPQRKINFEINNGTLEQALEIAAIQSKSVWKAVTENIIFVYQDQPQKRHDYEEQVIRVFPLANTTQAQDITEIVTGLRQLLDLKRIQPLNSQNAIVIRDTPDRLQIIEKVLQDVDKARPEVIIQVEILQARTDRLRDLGIAPGQKASISITPPASSSSSSTASTLTLSNLAHLNSSAYGVTLPSVTANAVLTDTESKIIQNPEIRSVDGQTAKLKIGDRLPVATGSFGAGLGVGGTAASGFVNPLVNTQFTYQDVGVNVDITPRVHPNREITLKVVIEVSSHSGDATIGGITQPIISQRKIDQEIRLKEGETNILGGLFERIDSRTVNGWPGLARIPIIRRFFSDDNIDHQENEVLVVLTPRIVRMPEWSLASMRPLYTGSETNPQVRRESDIRSPAQQPAAKPPANPPATQQNPAPDPSTAKTANLRFEPPTASLKTGQKATLGVVVENVTDLSSIPLLVQYNPAVISLEEIQHGGFLSGGTQEIAIVQQVMKENGKETGQAIVSATRQPNTPGVSGSGTLLGLVVRAIAPGASNISIVQVNAKDSQQKPISLVTSEATVQVQP